MRLHQPLVLRPSAIPARWYGQVLRLGVWLTQNKKQRGTGLLATQVAAAPGFRERPAIASM